MTLKIYGLGLFFFLAFFNSYGQSRQEKTLVIINKLNLTESQVAFYKIDLESLKNLASGKDSIEIIAIEKRLLEDTITNRIALVFDTFYTKKEINSLYKFLQSSAYEKLFLSDETFQSISSQFVDIEKDIEELKTRLDNQAKEKSTSFKPIPIERQNGFYETIEYGSTTSYNEITLLQEKPSLSSEDILNAQKDYRSNDKKPIVTINFTKEGANKFYILTKENIGKPIAIVIENRIVSMPIVVSEIMGGKASISGDFSEEEIDEMVRILNEK